MFFCKSQDVDVSSFSILSELQAARHAARGASLPDLVDLWPAAGGSHRHPRLPREAQTRGARWMENPVPRHLWKPSYEDHGWQWGLVSISSTGEIQLFFCITLYLSISGIMAIDSLFGPRSRDDLRPGRRRRVAHHARRFCRSKPRRGRRCRKRKESWSNGTLPMDPNGGAK